MRYKTAEGMMADFAPDRQSTFALYPLKCVSGDCITLADFRRIWGANLVELWVAIHVRDFATYAGSPKKLTANAIEDTARIIIANYYYLKLSEVMLFFAYLKGGHYERIYAAVDPLVITSSLRMFLQDRDKYLIRAEREKQAREREKQAKERGKETTLNYEEWKQYKPFYEKGISVEEWKQTRKGAFKRV